MPPSVDNYSIAGDISFNTSQPFNIGTTYDLFTVAAHEFGHALGLGQSAVTTAIMYGSYSGVRAGLPADDISGIRNIYSGNNPRSQDSGSNNTFATATALTSLINPSDLTALATNLDISTTTDLDYYTLVAPTGTSSTVTISLQSQGLSLLSPKLWVYGADQTTLLGSANGSGQYGTTLTVTLSNKIAAGQQFYIKAAGADGTAFGTGAYALSMSFAGAALPSVPVPNTQLANGTPLSGGGGIAMAGADHSPGSQTDVIAAVEAEHQPTGGGCNCPLCRAAVQRTQEQLDLLTGRDLNQPKTVLGGFVGALAQSTSPEAPVDAIPMQWKDEGNQPVEMVIGSESTRSHLVLTTGADGALADAFFADEGWLDAGL